MLRCFWVRMAPNRTAMIWPVSILGQSQFLRDLLETVATVRDTAGAGVIWWYPEAILVPGLFVWGGGSLALFDGGGHVLPAASVFGLP